MYFSCPFSSCRFSVAFPFVSRRFPPVGFLSCPLAFSRVLCLLWSDWYSAQEEARGQRLSIRWVVPEVHNSGILFLPPANEVWRKVLFSEVCVSHSVHRIVSPWCHFVSGCPVSCSFSEGGLCPEGSLSLFLSRKNRKGIRKAGSSPFYWKTLFSV